MIKIIPETGTKQTLFKTINQDLPRIHTGLRKALFQMGRESVRHARGLITDKKKTGRIYLINGKKHQASAPGEAPANLSGSLRRSVKYVVRGYLEAEFGDKIFYGKYLEEGTTNKDGSTRIAPRPHLVRTAKEKAADNQKLLISHVDRALKK